MDLPKLLMDLILFFEALSFLVSLLLYFKKNVPRYLRFFPIFLFITVIVETIGYVLREDGLKSRPMFNYFTTFEFVFYFFVLGQILKNSRIRKTILYVNILYPVVAIIYIQTQDFYAFHSVTYNIGAIAVVSFSIYYFYEVFKTTVIDKLLKEPSFWICTGLLIYYSCTVPLAGVINYLNPKIALEETLGRLILVITNFILYASFIMAFICAVRFRKS